MTDIEKKALEAYPIHPSYGEAQITIKKDEDTHIDLRKGYTQALIEYESLPKIHGWVARDKDGSVRLFEKKPEWTHNRWEGHHFYLGGEKFGIDVKRAEPVEVELLIRKV